MMTAAPLKSDDALITLNTAIKFALEQYLPPELIKPGGIRFDMVDKDNLPDAPTVCVFLYDIQEDLELRHGQPRHYQPDNNRLTPRQVHVRCCYLLTYWEAKGSAGAHDPARSQQLQVINAALNAVLNMSLTGLTGFPELPPAFVRVIAPSEHLSSLGNFWQSMGDKPRLCLSFNVTIPISLGLESEESVRKVQTAELHDTPELRDTPELKAIMASWALEDRALQFKRKMITRVLAAFSGQPVDWGAVRTTLASLQVSCSNLDETLKINVSGSLDASLYEKVTQVIHAMQSSGVDTTNLKSIANPQSL